MRTTIAEFEADWRHLARSGRARALVERLGANEPHLATVGLVDLTGLIELLAPTSSLSPTRRAELIAALVRQAHIDPLVERTILQAILPGLIGVGASLSWGRGGGWVDPGEFAGDLLSSALEVIRGFAGEDRPYALLDILNAVRHRLRRARQRHRRYVVRQAICDPPDSPDPLDCHAEAIERIEFARTLERARLSRNERALLIGNVVIGYTLSELGEASGIDRRELGARRRRLADRLALVGP